MDHLDRILGRHQLKPQISNASRFADNTPQISSNLQRLMLPDGGPRIKAVKRIVSKDTPAENSARRPSTNNKRNIDKALINNSANTSSKEIQKPQKQDNILFKKQLSFSRNYHEYMKQAQQDPQQIEEVFPEEKPEETESIFKLKQLEPKLEKRSSKFIKAIKMRYDNKGKQSKIPNFKLDDNPNNATIIYCSRCAKKHPSDLHQRIQQQRLEERKKRQNIPSLLPKKRKEPETPRKSITHYSSTESDQEIDGSEDEEELSDFIDDSDTYDQRKISQTVRKLFNYDPKKYKDIDRLDDKDMEASAQQILREENYSTYVGRKEDEREYELEKRMRLKKRN